MRTLGKVDRRCTTEIGWRCEREGILMTKSANRPQHRPEDEEERLDRAIRSHMGTGPENYTPELWRSMRAHARLPLLYAGRWVAFLDTYEGEKDERRLVHRQVLCDSRTLEGLYKRMAKLPEEQGKAANFVYVDRGHFRIA